MKVFRKHGSPSLASTLLLAALAAAGCSRSPAGRWQGYVEAEFVRVAAPLSGTLERLEVRRGDTVAAGQPLFSLEREADEAAWREAVGRLEQARRRHDNLTKGRRAPEIAALEARLAQSRAALDLAESELERARRLIAAGAIAQSELDRSQMARDHEGQGLQALAAELATARLGAREDEIAAAAAETASATAGVSRAEWSLRQKDQASPVAALVQDTFYRPGEWVAAGSPVVSLLPPDQLKVRFFVPEPQLGSVRIGQALRVWIDGAQAPVPGTIRYIAPQAEYTPPVIYSQENRAKLVFMVEVSFVPADAVRLHPGQPVEVGPAG